MNFDVELAKCRECHRIDGRRQSALISAAKNHLGLSWSQYVAAYGQSSGAAKAVLASAGVDPLSVLEGL